MMPRHAAPRARRGAGFRAASCAPRKRWGAASVRACSLACLLWIAVSCISQGVLGAEPSARGASAQATTPANQVEPTLSHFNGLRELSGASYRAFKNRLKRHMRGALCLRYHVAATWWHYEWCLDRHVRQFHPLPASKSSAGSEKTEKSILLGVYNAEKPRPLRIVAVDNLERLTDPDRMGYAAQQSYENGAFCAASGAKRSVSVRIKCCALHTNETYIDAVEERSTCQYELNVCSPLACGLMQRDQFVLNAPPHMADDERTALASTVRGMFYHAYNGYMTHAFPQDDLLPLSCRGGEFELGRIPMLTLIDTLDTLAILEDATEFRRAVALVVERANFELDTEVSVFETTIRVLGGLLSSHLFAVDPKLAFYPSGGYNDELLKLAVDLGDRLMPAFDTPTGIPYGTVNLKRGVPKGETPIASTAGAGSLSIEFTMLSVLTRDAKYAAASRGAVRALFQHRSKLGLLGKHISTKTGDWTESSSGPGSNADSFYEYLLKMYSLFGDRESLEMFAEVYPAVLQHNKHGDWYTDVSMYTGCHHHGGNSGVIFESLAAFWPGMQAAVGDLGTASKSMNAFYRVWRDYGFLSEQFNVLDWKPVRSRGGGGARYPLRPELVESTLYMHEATNDSSWLRAGAHVVHSLQKYTKTPCGYASIADVESKKQEDNMPSFFLSETAKYLYLLFNTTHFYRHGNYVMTTEAHPLPILPSKVVDPILRAADAYVDSQTKDKMANRSKFAPEHVLRCEAPRFYDTVGYSLRYTSKVQARTPRCSPPVQSPSASAVKSTKTSAAKLTIGGGDSMTEVTVSVDTDGDSDDVETESKLKEWLPVLKEKLRQLDGSSSSEGDAASAKDANPAWVQQLLRENEKRLKNNIPTEVPQHLYSGDDPVQSLYGGSQLGTFTIEQLPGLLRITRDDTGDWLEFSGITDARHMIVGVGYGEGVDVDADPNAGADSYALDKSAKPTSEKGPQQLTGKDEDDYPPILAWNHVYKVDDDGSLPADQRCALQVQVSLKSSSGSDPTDPEVYQHGLGSKAASASTTWLAVPCVGAGFGVTDELRNSRAFSAVPIVVADPVDACTAPLLNAPEDSLRGKMVLVHRGECYFETKARNAAARGAAGVIVVNNEDDDYVMVMGGLDKSEDDDEEREKLRVPVVMIPRRLGDWFEARIAGAKTESLPAVRVGIELTVRHHEPKTTAVRRRPAGGSEFPLIEGTVDNMRVFGPVWGVQLVATTPLDSPDSRTQQGEEEGIHRESFGIAILGTPPWEH